MTEKEGVIKYNLNHQNWPIDDYISLSEINAWRTILFKLGMIGQDKKRYEGYGFGNISQKVFLQTSSHNQFLITGTQTGELASLSKHHYCIILEANPKKNSIQSIGEIKPSSEALTHASIYQKNSTIQTVIHVHSPEIWQKTEQLKLPFIDAKIVYGSVKMAIAVEELIVQLQPKSTGIFSMLGHKDGIVAFSDSIEKAAILLIKYYRTSLQIHD